MCIRDRGGDCPSLSPDPETPVKDRRTILDAYKVKAGKVVEGYFEKLPDPADHPVFALHPA